MSDADLPSALAPIVCLPIGKLHYLFLDSFPLFTTSKNVGKDKALRCRPHPRAEIRAHFSLWLLHLFLKGLLLRRLSNATITNFDIRQPRPRAYTMRGGAATVHPSANRYRRRSQRPAG